jgi:hypothetical protein
VLLGGAGRGGDLLSQIQLIREKRDTENMEGEKKRVWGVGYEAGAGLTCVPPARHTMPGSTHDSVSVCWAG